MFNVEDINKHIIASDTDSIFINLESLLIKKYPNIDLNDNENVIPLVKEIQKNIEHKLNSYQNQLAGTILNSHNHYFDLKSESIIKKAYWSGKRRYAQLIVDKEGVPVEELDMKGLDLMKSNMPKIFYQFGEGLIRDIMFGKSKKEIDNKIIDFRREINSMDWRKVVRPTGVKIINKYIKRKPKAGEIFSELHLKCPINTKSAIYHNDILRFKRLENQHPLIMEGDKIKYVQLKPNPYHIEVIATIDSDPEYITSFIEQYVDKERTFDSGLLNKLKGLYEDLGWGDDFPSLNEKVSKFFKFG